MNIYNKVVPNHDMAQSAAKTTDFIADAKQHNEWWGGNEPSSDLKELTSESMKPRSDLFKILRQVDECHDDDVRELAYSIYGPTGIGKTTVLLQSIAALLPHDWIETETGHRDLDIIGSVNPKQILYIPLEDSLYHLEQPDKALEELRKVVDYFRSHIAPRGQRNYIFLDDIGALSLDDQRRDKLLDLFGGGTYLFVTGIVESQAKLSGGTGDSKFKHRTWPMLPMKFSDMVQRGAYRNSSLADFDREIEDRIEALRTDSIDDRESLIDEIRGDIANADTLDNAVTKLERLYFTTFSDSERDGLHDAAREFIQKGGDFGRIDDFSIKNELIRSHFLLYLYKELARYESIQRPENLHRLSSLAATEAGSEVKYTDISDQLEVDRRTVDTYLDALEEGLSVTESHDFSLLRHRRTRLYLRNPRHAVLLSQRQEHHGFESYDPSNVLNHEFEYTLARTVGFDHSMRLAFNVSGPNPTVEYYDTDEGTIDYIIHDDGLVLPFVLSYHPHGGNGEQIAATFDPSVGKHSTGENEELRDLEYDAPYRFVITDSLPREVTETESLVVERDDVKICYLPFWLFLTIC